MASSVLHIFGASSNSGYAFLSQVCSLGLFPQIYVYSRDPNLPAKLSLLSSIFCCIDITDTSCFKYLPFIASPSPFVLISFLRIDIFDHFISDLLIRFPDFLLSCDAIIALSSSSAVVKRYSSNSYDKLLSSGLKIAETSLLSRSCSSMPVQIIRPTLIYGSLIKPDQNISLLSKLVLFLPLLILPSFSGLRQPIHCNQLAFVVIFSLSRLLNGVLTLPPVLSVGGDEAISYYHMLLRILKYSRRRRYNLFPIILIIPARLFFFLCSPIALISPKIFESLLRICSDLAGFPSVSEITGSDPLLFLDDPSFLLSDSS